MNWIRHNYFARLASLSVAVALSVPSPAHARAPGSKDPQQPASNPNSLALHTNEADLTPPQDGAGPQQATVQRNDTASQQRIGPVPPPPKGVGMMVGGSTIALLLGAPLTILGASMLAAIESVPPLDPAGTVESVQKTSRGVIWGTLLLPGLLSLAGGTVMIVFGAKRYSRYSDWKSSQNMARKRLRLVPSIATTRNRTGVFGLQGQF